MIPEFTYKHLYFLGFLIGSFLRIFFPDILNITYKETNYLKVLLAQCYMEIIRNISSDILMGIFYFIDYIRNKEEYKERKELINTKNDYIYNEGTKKKEGLMLKYIFIISFIDIICQLAIPIKYLIEHFIFNKDDYYLTTEPELLYSFLLFDLFGRYFLSRLILKTYFYIHHNLSFVLYIISIAILVIVDYKYKYGLKKRSNNGYDILYMVVIGIKLIFYSLEDIMNKKAFITLFILPKALIFYKGLFQLLVYFPIITVLIFSFKQCDFQKNEFFKNEIKFFVCFVPFNILRTSCLVDVIDKFNAQLMGFLKVSQAIIFYIYFIFKYKEQFKIETWAIFLQAIAFIILFFSSLIYNEIIIINHPKLKAKTEFYLDKDADREQNISIYSDTFISESKDQSTSSDNDEKGLYDDLTGSDMS